MWSGTFAFVLTVLPALQTGVPGDRLYGRVVTAGGDRLEGYLRWDRNETHWADFLDGRKEIPWENVWEAERLDEDFRRRRARERSISLLGLRIAWDEDELDDPLTASSAVRFGHLRSLEVVDDRRAVLVLKTGQEVTLEGVSTDIGRSFRRLVVEDLERGEVELRWRDLDRVEFSSAPAGRPPPDAERLYGTVRTRGGGELTGFVTWDMDEVLTTDVLDGEADGRDYELPFGSVSAIERDGRSRSRVTLTSGEELILRGTNDVNADNRGIEISDPSFGRAVVSWDEFESVIFHAPSGAGAAYDSFDGGRVLRGTVETRAGEALTGALRWDNDEERTWEVLDGTSEGVDYDVELSSVRSVERVGLSAARVRLLDGRSLLLEGSNDVNADNLGIFVRPEAAETVLVRWADLRRVTFGG